MNPYKLDFSSLQHEIIEALIDVFGEEYAPLIIERFHSMYFVPYVNYYGMYAYYKFLMSCKSKEMALKFLKSIGIDLRNYDIKSYADPLPKELEIMCEGLIGGVSGFESLFQESPLGCKSFVPKYCENYTTDYIDANRIDFINAVKPYNVDEITLDNYKEFINTIEYKRIEDLAIYYTSIFEKLLTEMNEYLSSIEEYKEYYKSENSRKRNLMEKARISLYTSVIEDLQGPIRTKVEEKDRLKDQAKSLLSNTVDNKSNIEYFSSEDEELLKDSNVSEFEKKWILIYRLSFLESMGVSVNVFEDDYYKVIEREDVKELIPSVELADQISTLRKAYLSQAENSFVKESDSYKETLSYFSTNSVNDIVVYNILKDDRVCINGGSDLSHNFKTIMYLTIRGWQCGCMDYVFIHELIHAIESVSLDGYDYSCGFENKVINPEYSELDHADRKRKYERFNEVVVDLLAKDVVDLLHSRGQYIFDDKDVTLSDFSDFNTHQILKDMVRPFYDKYKSLIIEARLSGKLFLLTHYIGEDNFEELNNIVDYVDVLIEKGLLSKLNKNEIDDPLVIDYYLQLERVERVYKDMAEVYDNAMYPRFYKKKRKRYDKS